MYGLASTAHVVVSAVLLQGVSLCTLVPKAPRNEKWTRCHQSHLASPNTARHLASANPIEVSRMATITTEPPHDLPDNKHVVACGLNEGLCSPVHLYKLPMLECTAESVLRMSLSLLYLGADGKSYTLVPKALCSICKPDKMCDGTVLVMASVTDRVTHAMCTPRECTASSPPRSSLSPPSCCRP